MAYKNNYYTGKVLETELENNLEKRLILRIPPGIPDTVVHNNVTTCPAAHSTVSGVLPTDNAKYSVAISVLPYDNVRHKRSLENMCFR